MESSDQQRRRLIDQQLKARGIRDQAVLGAVDGVPREAFLPPEMAEFAYLDRALPIEKGQTISQPYIVALMTEALELESGDRVLEIGTGSGYAAAILGKIAAEVYTIERHAELAELAERRLREQGFANVHVLHADGTLGWPEHAPFQAIVVAAGGPEIPQPLLAQLAIGGRLVIPVGADLETQNLIRVTRISEDEYHRENLGGVRFVPLIGAAGWREGESEGALLGPEPQASRPETIESLIREVAEPFSELRGPHLGGLLERIGDCPLVLIGEATHGTSEFYRMRAEITKELIQRHGFRFVAVEADWPDAARIDQYVRQLAPPDGQQWTAFSRFPTWMWRNGEVLEFIEWLRNYNASIENPQERVAFYGLDLYSMFTSIRAVLDYLDRVDPESARVARLRYGCLTPWESDPALYGRMVLGGRYRLCEKEAVAALQDLLKQRLQYAQYDGVRFLDAVHNARLVANAERYYRIMYYGSHQSWNVRDRHMFETLQLIMGTHGATARGVVWEHNSHLGNAAATEMGASGEINVGQLARQEYGDLAYLIGQGTDHGTVAAASAWDEDVQIMQVQPSHPESYERLFHETRTEAFLLPLRTPRRPELREELDAQRLERAIGVIYRPDTERQSHYFHARLPHQFDEFIWFDRTRAVHPISAGEARGLPEHHPFSLQ